ncbi:MAG TPA: hypothetical protein VJL28_03470 [Gemmatimonadaceae bacterium]|nr:hypothetical protein [Gemmatimonadaceae bacterium]
MRFLSELWMPILVSGAFCFVWSAIAWTVLPHHKTEWRRLPSEPDVLDALRRTPPPGGLYTFPFAMGADMNRADLKVAMERGPVGFVTIGKAGVPNMGKMMAQSVVFYLVTSTLAAYVAWNAGLGLGAPYRSVFRLVGTVVTMAYVLGSVPESIWFARPWKSWGYQLFDGIVAGLITAGVFGWLWPQ